MATKKTTSTASPKKSTALAKWSEKFAQYAKKGVEQLSGIGLGGTSVKFGRGTIDVGDKTIKDGKLQVVVLGYCAHNRWFKGKYNPKETAPPDCYAFAETFDDETMAPHAASADKQSDLCATCDLNKFGSAETGRGKACQNTIRLGLLLASDIEEEGAKGIAKMEMANASISPTNLKHFKAFADALAEEHGVPMWAVVAEVQTFDDPDTQIRVEWSLSEFIEDDEVLTALEKRFLKIQDVLQVAYQSAGADDKKDSKKPTAGKTRKFANGKR